MGQIPAQNGVVVPLGIRRKKNSLFVSITTLFTRHGLQMKDDIANKLRLFPLCFNRLCNACGLRYSRSIARQTKVAQQREDRSSDSIDSHDRLPHKRPLREQESIALPQYLGQSRYKMSPTEEHPITASTMVGPDTFKEPLEQHLPKTREYSDRLYHSASASVPTRRLY